MTNKLREGAVERLTSALGAPLFEFVVNAPLATIIDGTAAAESIATVRQMDDLLMTEVEGRVDPDGMKQVLVGRLVDTREPPEPLALQLHRHCGGVLDLPEASFEYEGHLIELAAHAYPSFLLPLEDDQMFGFRRAGWHATSALFRDPVSDILQTGLLKDKVFKATFQHEQGATGRYAMLSRSTGSGGSMQLVMLAEQVLSNAWNLLNDSEAPTLGEFSSEALRQLQFLKDAFAGTPSTVRSRMAFAGVRLPGNAVDFGDVVVRPATQEEHDSAPESLKGQLSSTDQSGATTIISYMGDVVAEHQVPYKVHVSKEPLGSDKPMEFPEKLLQTTSQDVSNRLRISLLLAVSRTERVQIAPTWQRIDDPLSSGYQLSWSDPRQFSGLVPAQLTKAEVLDWQEWYDLLADPRVEKIQLAITRVVRATAERRDPVDVLIDSVIAWENLFGTKDGEPTLRVTASLALLLEADPTKRRTLRSRLSKIYGLRSNAVHGSSMPKSDEVPLCLEALTVAISALRAILKERPDLLDESDGGARSLNMILSQPPA